MFFKGILYPRVCDVRARCVCATFVFIRLRIRSIFREHDHSKFSISDEDLEDAGNDAGVINGINAFDNSTKDDAESYRIGNGRGNGNGHGHGHGSSLSILQNDSIDDEEAARQIALYSMQQGQANLNMVH